MDVNYAFYKERFLGEYEEGLYSIRQLKSFGIYPKIKADSIKGLDITDDFVMRSIGSLIHGYYVCIEELFIYTNNMYGNIKMNTDSWHRDLVIVMSKDIQGYRVKLIREDTVEMLDELRRFRHFFVKGYGNKYNSDKLYAIVKNLPKIVNALERDFKSYFKYMDAMYLGE